MEIIGYNLQSKQCNLHYFSLSSFLLQCVYKIATNNTVYGWPNDHTMDSLDNPLLGYSMLLTPFFQQVYARASVHLRTHFHLLSGSSFKKHTHTHNPTLLGRLPVSFEQFVPGKSNANKRWNQTLVRMLAKENLARGGGGKHKNSTPPQCSKATLKIYFLVAVSKHSTQYTHKTYSLTQIKMYCC